MEMETTQVEWNARLELWSRHMEIIQHLLQTVESASEEAMALQLAKENVTPKKYLRLFMDMEEELNELKESLHTLVQGE